MATASRRGGLSVKIRCKRRRTYCSHFGVRMQFAVLLFLVAHASALGRARTGVVKLLKIPAGGTFSSTVENQEPPLIPSTKSQDFLHDSEQLLLSERGLPLIIENTPRWQREDQQPHREHGALTMVHPDDPQHGGLDDHDYIRKQMPSWAAWDPDSWTDPEPPHKEYLSEPCVWIDVTDSLRTDDNGHFWISEFGLTSGYQDLLRLQDRTWGSDQRPWRSWEGCRFFGDCLTKARAAARARGLKADVWIKKRGQTYKQTKEVLFACFSKDCKKKWHSGSQDMESAVAAYWGHLEESSKNEAQEARDGGDRSCMVHPIRPMMAQFDAFWNKKVKKEADLRLHEQGAPPSPRAAKAAKDHQREYCGEQPRTQDRRGPAPRPGEASVRGAHVALAKQKPGKKGPAPPRVPPPVPEENLWDGTWGGSITDEMMKSWDILPKGNIEERQSQQHRRPAPRASQSMASSSHTISSMQSQGPKQPFLRAIRPKSQAASDHGEGDEHEHSPPPAGDPEEELDGGTDMVMVNEGEADPGAGLSGGEASESSVGGETILTTGTFGGMKTETDAGEEVEEKPEAKPGAEGKRPRGNRAGWKIQQKRRREEWEGKGGKGGWTSKRHSGYTSDDWRSWKRDRSGYDRGGYESSEEWRAWKRENAAKAWNQRMMERGDASKAKKFHQGFRKISVQNGTIMDWTAPSTEAERWLLPRAARGPVADGMIRMQPRRCSTGCACRARSRLLQAGAGGAKRQPLPTRRKS